MSTLNGQNNDHDQALLHVVEQIVQGEAHTPHDPHSPLGIAARLAGTVPQPDAAFADQLEARLVAAAAQRKEATIMNVTNKRFIKQFTPLRNILRLPRFVLRSAVVGLVGLVLIGGWQLNTRAAQARVEQMAQRFGLVVIYPEVVEAGLPSLAPEALATAQAEPVPSAQVYVPQKLSLEEAQQRTPFPIRLPTWLPPGVEMTALDVGEGSWGCSAPTIEDCAKIKPPVAVHMMYRLPTDAEANVMLDITEITPEGGGGYAVAADALESVTVSGQPAVYTRGGEEMVDGNIENLVWNSAADHHFLSWEENGQIYTLSSYKLGLSRDDMIRIAESLR